MYKEISDNIHKELRNFKVVHGHYAINYFRENKFDYVPKISKDIQIVMITNYPYQNEFNKLYTENKDKINIEYIILNTTNFRCGVDLIVPLYEYIKTINTKYVLYMDASDTIITSDIEDPKSILDFYNCKILFNAEDGYSFPDHNCVPKDYLELYAKHNNEPAHYYYENRRNKIMDININNLHSKINCAPYCKSLNSGLFLGERDYMENILSEMIDLMNADPTKGYPYGEIENQKLWQYLQSQCKNNEIEIDYLNRYFLWSHQYKFNFPVDHWEHFNYFNKLIKP
jgi:hypothetical protein